MAEGGVTLLHCSDCVQMPPALEAVDASSTVHRGEIHELARERPSWPIAPRSYFAWRPAQPLSAGVYRLRVVVASAEEEDPCSLATFGAAIRVPENPEPATADALPGPQLTLGTANRQAGTVFECRDRCDPARLGTRSQVAPYLEHRIAVDEDHAARARYLVRLVAETENSAILEGPWWSLDAVTGAMVMENGRFVAEAMQRGGVTFPATQTEYCAHIEWLDIVDDMRTTIDAGCVQDDLPDGLQTVPAFGMCEGFEGATMEQYLEAFCGDNAQDCAGGDYLCDEWRKQCTRQPDPPDASTAMPEDAGPRPAGQTEDAGAETEEPEDERPEHEAPEDEGADDAGGEARAEMQPGSGGCHFAAGAATPVRWPLLLIAVWLARRKRRAR